MTEVRAARTNPDWERIEGDYRAGVLSLREIATRDGHVTEGAIRKRAKRDKWVRDLSDKIKAKADDLVRRSVRTGTQQPDASEREVIDSNAAALANTKLEHHGSLRRSRDLTGKLLTELEQQTDDPEAFAKLVAALAESGADDAPAVRSALRRAMSLGARASILKSLTEAQRNWITLERQAWGMDDPEKPPQDLHELTDDEIEERIRGVEAQLARGPR